MLNLSYIDPLILCISKVDKFMYSTSSILSPCHPIVHTLVCSIKQAKALRPLVVQNKTLSPRGRFFSYFFMSALSFLYSSHSNNRCFVSCRLAAQQKHLLFDALPIIY